MALKFSKLKPNASSELPVEEDSNSAEIGTAAKPSKKSGKNDNEEPRLDKMKKKDLLEIMLAQGEEIDALRARVAELEAQLADRELQFQKVGSIAEASLQVTDIFKEAEKAAAIYLENIRRRYE